MAILHRDFRMLGLPNSDTAVVTKCTSKALEGGTVTEKLQGGHDSANLIVQIVSDYLKDQRAGTITVELLSGSSNIFVFTIAQYPK